MKALLGIAVVVIAVWVAQGAGNTTVEVGGIEYTNISDVHISGNGGIFISAANGMTVVSVDKLPDDFLNSWNINKGSAAATQENKSRELEEGKMKTLDAAIANGSFREIDDVVYDIRNPESGWTYFAQAKVMQALGNNTAIVDVTPEGSGYYPIHVKNLPDVADTDVFNFTAKLTGNFSYINKFNDTRTIRDYDIGQACSRDQIPATVLLGRKAYDVIALGGVPVKDAEAPPAEDNDLQATGSGFFITDDGYLITNYHVIKDAKKVKVKNGASVYPAAIAHVDQDNDLALLKVAGQFQPLPISTNDAQLGEAVFTIGFPDILLQGTEPKYTDGKISSLAGIRDDPRDYQISVPVQPGNSGGPLVDMEGNVVGVVEAKLNDIAALSISGDLPQNVNYAIKGKYLNDFLGQFPEITLSPAKPVSPGGVIQSTQKSVATVLVY